MARRNKIELAGIELQKKVLSKYFKEGKTLKEIEKELKEEGYEVSKSGVHRFIQKHKTTARMLLIAKDKVDDKELIEQSQALQEIAYGIVMEAFSLFEKRETDPATRLAFALSLLEKTSSAIRATAQVSKTKFEIREYWDKLLEEIKAQIEALPANDEEKVRVVELIKKAFERVVK